MSDRWLPAYIGVGSNLDEPAKQLRAGIAAIDRIPDTRLVLQSPIYRSAPMGPCDQPDFLNAVVAVMTRLAPERLLEHLLDIEAAQGRDRRVGRWGPRSLDLDLLSVAAIVRDTHDLSLPHPGIPDRNFVLLPWSDIAPHYLVPGLDTVSRLAAVVPGEPDIRLEG